MTGTVTPRPDEPSPPDTADPVGAAPDPEAGWLRLDSRVVWVDAARALLSLIPGGLAVFVFGQRIDDFWIRSALFATAIGLIGAIADFLRWFKTRYRVTEDHIELRTGLFFRKHRTVRLTLIRSVDAKAKLRHRLAGLRILRVEAGQRSVGEAAFELDAVSVAAANRLRERLLDRAEVAVASSAGPRPAAAAEPEAEAADTVLARFRWQWFVHNMFTIWAYLMAAGLVWGAAMLAQFVGLDVLGWYRGLLADWRLDWWQSAAVSAALLGGVGVVGLAANFFTENWNFTLLRSRTGEATTLRTAKGLFSTREVNRDEARLRGLQLRQPLLWRWLGTTSLSAISTGLSMFGDARELLPNTHVTEARRVAGLVLPQGKSLFTRQLWPHPYPALRRRLSRATAVTAALTTVAWYLGVTVPVVPDTAWLYCGAIGWPVSIGLAVASFRSLGHLADVDFIVTRSGVLGTTTAVLRRRAVIGWTVRQSLFQRRLGLMSVTAATAAGDREYSVLDAAEPDALRFADTALPGLLAPFLEPVPDDGRPVTAAGGVSR